MIYNEKPKPGLLTRQWQEDTHERMKVILFLFSLSLAVFLMFLLSSSLGFFLVLLSLSRLSEGYNEETITRAALSPDQ